MDTPEGAASRELGIRVAIHKGMGRNQNGITSSSGGLRYVKITTSIGNNTLTLVGLGVKLAYKFTTNQISFIGPASKSHFSKRPNAAVRKRTGGYLYLRAMSVQK